MDRWLSRLFEQDERHATLEDTALVLERPRVLPNRRLLKRLPSGRIETSDLDPKPSSRRWPRNVFHVRRRLNLADKLIHLRRKMKEETDAKSGASWRMYGPLCRRTRGILRRASVVYRRSTWKSEAAARKAVVSQDLSLDTVLRILRMVKFPKNSTRKNVIPRGGKFVNSLLLGLYQYGPNVGSTKGTELHKWLVKLLTKAFRAEFADYPFTSIQINSNYAARPHVDKNNMGASCMVALGNHTGGKLWVHDEESGTVPFHFTESEDAINATYCFGKVFKGIELDARNSWQKFDGNRMHFTLPIQGERYSLIYYVCAGCLSAPIVEQSKLHMAGFDFCFDSPNWQKLREEKRKDKVNDRNRRIKENREAIPLRDRCIAVASDRMSNERCPSACADGEQICEAHAHIGGGRWKRYVCTDKLRQAKADEPDQVPQSKRWRRVLNFD